MEEQNKLMLCGYKNFYDYAIFIVCEFSPNTFEEWCDLLRVSRHSFLTAWKAATGKTYEQFVRDMMASGVRTDDAQTVMNVIIPADWTELVAERKRILEKMGVDDDD